MSKKKVKAPKKKTTVKKKKSSSPVREKVIGEPSPVKPAPRNIEQEIYPRIIFHEESLWVKIKKFFGFY